MEKKITSAYSFNAWDVGQQTSKEMHDTRHYSNRLLDLVSASGEGNDAADEAAFERGQQRR